MNIVDGFIDRFGYNHHSINRLTENISHNESMILPSFKGNNMNWVIGHIIESRNELLEIIGSQPIWDEFARMKYQSGSRVVSDLDNPGEEFSMLLTDIESTHALIVSRLKELTDSDLLMTVGEGEQKGTIAATINGYIWHETYHIGQLELLRQVAGKTEKVF